MSRLITVYYPAKLIKCPEKWTHYKYMVYNTPLYIHESEHKYPGKKWFSYGGLCSSVFKSFETRQKTINDNITIDIVTKSGSHYIFEVGEDNYGLFCVGIT